MERKREVVLNWINEIARRLRVLIMCFGCGISRYWDGSMIRHDGGHELDCTYG
jgi:hypothetical protein